MRAVVQRVNSASVEIDGEVYSKIGRGLMVLLGVQTSDTTDDARYIADKILGLRIFEDEEGKMNRSLLDIDGELLIVSQFTLMGDARKGRRPSFTDAAPGPIAESLYESVIEHCRQKVNRVATGKFQAYMTVNIANDGPVTILLDSKRQF
jgi:D-tyrosyl-tRNA(Tyr) deacylase